MRAEGLHDVWMLILRNPVLNKADLARIALVSKEINVCATYALYHTLDIVFSRLAISPTLRMKQILQKPDKLVPAVRRLYLLVRDSVANPGKIDSILLMQLCKQCPLHTFQVRRRL
jgi:hypothetical protein